MLLFSDTHRLLPGITAGDIGPKSFNGNAPNDNGFARFNRVRIPKENMLSKFAQVTDDGKYVQPPHAKISYGGVSLGNSSFIDCTTNFSSACRCCTFDPGKLMMTFQPTQASLDNYSRMVTAAGWITAKGEPSASILNSFALNTIQAAVIAIRYATVRRQGNRGPDGLEKQVISHPSLHVRLLPILSRAYVFIGLGRALVSLSSPSPVPLLKPCIIHRLKPSILWRNVYQAEIHLFWRNCTQRQAG